MIGTIADDKMREAMSSFIDNALTDKGLYHCLSSVDYGIQVVAKTPYACRRIEILEEHCLKGAELENAIRFSEEKRRECRSIVNEAKRDYDGTGKTFYSMIKREKQKEETKRAGHGQH